MKHKGFKLLAWLLVLTMTLGMLPFSAMAANDAPPETTQTVQETEPTTPADEAAEPEKPEASPPSEPQAEVQPTAQPSSTENTDEGLIAPTELPELPDPTEPQAPQAPSLDEPIQNDAVAKPKEDEALSPEEPAAPAKPPETAVENGYIGSDGKVKLYSFCDANVYLYEKSTSFPYITTYGYNMNPSETEFTSSSKYGQLFYCIDYYAHIGDAGSSDTQPGTDLLKTQKWLTLSFDAQRGITFALLYGAPNCDTYYDNIYGYAATQLIIWEFQLGKRTYASDNLYTSGSIFYQTLSHNTKLKEAYDAILANMRAHEKSPKFDPPSVTLNGYGRENGAWLTDTNNIISHDIWSVSTTTPGFRVEQSGNRIFIYALENGGAVPGTTVSVKLTRNIKTSTGSALCSRIKDQACITGSPPDPLDVRVNVNLMPYVPASITKRVTGLDGSSALRKKTFFVFEGWSNYQKWHDDTDPATCNQYVAAWLKTDENGACISSAQLQVGKNYYILEALDESNIVRYEENGVSYVTDIFRRNANYPQMSVTGADAKTSGNVVKPMDGKMYVYGQMITFTPQSGSNVAILCQNEVPSDGTAKKISESANVDGYRFKFYSYNGNSAVYGISDESGDIYITDENYTEVEKGKRTYTFDNFQDGVWRTDRWKFMAALETLTEQQFNEGLRPVSWRIRIGRKDGSTAFDKTYTYPEDIYADANNANTYRIEVFSEETENPFTGLDGGGSITMEITNEYPWKFQLVKRDATTNQNLPGAKFELTKGEESWDVADNGDGTYTTKALPYGTYTLKETQAPDGYVLDEKEYTVTVDESGISCEGLTMENGMVVFPNSKPIGSVDILKQDSAGQPLDGVVFRLEVEENGQWQLVSDQTTVDGKAAWSELPIYQARQTEDGTVLDWITYRLTEIQTVDGNQLLGKPVFEGTFEDKLDEESQTYHLSYCVLNTPGFQMPPAGESGNLWLSVLGLCGMVACGGAMVLLMRRKRWKPL